jgi:hypothetical protein
MAKARPGQPAGKMLRSARAFNSAQQAAEYYEKQMALGQGIDPILKPVPTDLIKVKNNSGDTRLRGDVLALTSALTPPPIDREHMWFNGDLPATRYDPFCVLLHQIPDGEIGDAQISGICIARVEGEANDDMRAYIQPGSAVMMSDHTGPIELLEPGRLNAGNPPAEFMVNLGPSEWKYRYIDVYFDGTFASGAAVDFFNDDGEPYDTLFLPTFGASSKYIQVIATGIYVASLSATMKSTTAPDGAELLLALQYFGGSQPVGQNCHAAREQLIRYDTYGNPVQYSAENVAFSRPIYLERLDQVSIYNLSNYSVVLTHAEFSLHFAGRFPEL